jgi:hypothetical protein
MDESSSPGWCFAIPESLLRQVLAALWASGVLQRRPGVRLVIEVERAVSEIREAEKPGAHG